MLLPSHPHTQYELQIVAPDPNLGETQPTRLMLTHPTSSFAHKLCLDELQIDYKSLFEAYNQGGNLETEALSNDLYNTKTALQNAIARAYADEDQTKLKSTTKELQLPPGIAVSGTLWQGTKWDNSPQDQAVIKPVLNFGAGEDVGEDGTDYDVTIFRILWEMPILGDDESQQSFGQSPKKPVVNKLTAKQEADARKQARKQAKNGV